MTITRARASWLRGALVGACSTVVTMTAHAAAGGGLPHGGGLLVALLLVCATTGAAVGGIALEGRRSRLLGIVGALGLAQVLGHLTLVVVGGHHMELTPAMVASHAAAAVVLGVAITAAEYLYVVCASVLCWLRLFATPAARSTPFVPRRVANVFVARPVLLRSGLGMRAPPMGIAAAA